ncbi:MAG: SDR family NAD(P)-dependent oxidoreductase, partial [Rhodospirillaceae bacterium]
MSEVSSFVATPLNRARIVITGGTSGIGLEAAIQYAMSGVPSILLNGRDPGRGETARRAVLAEAPDTDVRFVSADVNETDGARAVAESA